MVFAGPFSSRGAPPNYGAFDQLFVPTRMNTLSLAPQELAYCLSNIKKGPYRIKRINQRKTKCSEVRILVPRETTC
jgi:hypothetical protein